MNELAKGKFLDKTSAADGGLLLFTAVCKFNVPSFSNAVKGLKKGQMYKQPIKNQVHATAVQQKSSVYLNGRFSGVKD